MAAAASARVSERENWRHWARRQHMPEYLCELLGTAIMMTIGIGAVAVIWSAGSPFSEWIPVPTLRRLFTGMIFAGGATAVVYSKLGQRSGAHINPAVTLGFLRMGKISVRDSACYILAQILGALLGIGILKLLLPAKLHQIQMGMTGPGQGYTLGQAFAAEAVMTFLLMATIIICISKTRIAPKTGLLAGSLVALMVMIGAPISGTSINPARSLAPALFFGSMQDQWIYWVAPPLGALLAVEILGSRFWGRLPLCAKLYHTERYDCCFDDCGHQNFRAGAVIMKEGEPGDTAYVVHRGEVEVRRGDRVLNTLGAHEWVGEMALLLNEPRSATVIAKTDVQLRPITRENLKHVLDEDPETGARVLTQMARRLAAADRMLAKGAV